MDSKEVNKAIRHSIRPLLKDLGFSRFTARTAWRDVAGRVEVLNFQSFNSYLAETIGATTYSFSVNLGCLLLEMPVHGIKGKEGSPRPQEYECHLRGRLSRGFRQRELKRRDTWYVDPDGRYLDRAMEDVRAAIERDAEPWFTRLRDSETVLDLLLNADEQVTDLWGFGANPSPSRSCMTAYIARSLGRTELAREHFNAVLASGCYQQVADEIRRDLQNLK